MMKNDFKKILAEVSNKKSKESDPVKIGSDKAKRTITQQKTKIKTYEEIFWL